MTSDHEFHTDGEYFQVPHKSKLDNLYLKPGDGMIVRTPGGGGYGVPTDRDQHALSNDDADGKISPAAARADYGHSAG